MRTGTEFKFSQLMRLPSKPYSIEKGSFNNYVDKIRGWGEGQKMSFFVHAQGIKTVHAGG